jgi:predicted PurR-regulated permease PerM
MKKEGWPDFPFFWLEKPNMSSLQIIASRLKEKVDSSRQSGFIGETTAMEKQIIEHLSGLHQQVLELNDALQASLQIIDDQRVSVRAKKALEWVRERVTAFVQTIRDNTFLTILGAASTLAFVITVLIYHFRFLKR